eukprot:9825800-Heterocapsa_arctica.AAC.1
MSLRIEVRLSLRIALAHGLAQNSPLRISRGTSFPGFSRNMPPDPRIHLASPGNYICPAILKTLDNALLKRLTTSFARPHHVRDEFRSEARWSWS